ncbi:MAG TPA: methylmalonyl-CoA mutase family protein [Actinomycetota bacterium]|nr:methylmalonyl-CoA mutase family protein [Actinomycetota bacterium]
MDDLEREALDWQQAYEAAPERDADFETLGGIPLKPLYTPLDSKDRDHATSIGFPGEYPYTRGVYTSGHRGRLWTMRQFAGFGSAADTNQRYRFLLEQGQTGLSVAFDMPTLMGRDPDDPLSVGEVGRCGAAVASLKDMETLFDSIPLGEVSVSMTISGPAAILFCMYLAVAEKQGVPFDRLDGTCQTDILKEYIAQKEWVYPPRPHLRLIGDMMEYCADHLPKYHPISVSGYHIREAGSTAAQELAFTLADGFSYVELGVDRGLDVNVFVPQLSFFFNSHIDFFEEIAKFRAARRIWARWMRDRYGATNPKAMLCRFHVQTAGCSLTLQQPYNNVVRTALEALAGVIGGCQSLHTNSLDEVFALPSEEAVEIALRTQQVIAYETGVANVIDPLGGSWFIESLTDRIEEEAEDYFRRIEKMGDGSMLEGTLKGIEDGFFQMEIAEAAYRQQQRFDAGRQIQVGVNAFTETVQGTPEFLRIPQDVEDRAIADLKQLRADRDGAACSAALAALTDAAGRDGENLIPHILDAVRAYATVGEISEAMAQVYGRYREQPRF